MINQNPALVLILVFLFIALVRSVYYQMKLRSIEGYWSEYQGYLNAISRDKYDWESYDKFAECQTEIIKQFEQAGLTSKPVPVYGEFPLGNNLQVQTGTAKSWEHLTATDERFVAMNRKTFHEAIGYFRARRNETFSIIYWIELIVFHPRKILSYISLVDEASVWAKGIHVVALIAEFLVAAGLYLQSCVPFSGFIQATTLLR